MLPSKPTPSTRSKFAPRRKSNGNAPGTSFTSSKLPPPERPDFAKSTFFTTLPTALTNPPTRCSYTHSASLGCTKWRPRLLAQNGVLPAQRAFSTVSPQSSSSFEQRFQRSSHTIHRSNSPQSEIKFQLYCSSLFPHQTRTTVKKNVHRNPHS